uniref:Programmed cell death protein n=1 Tax=Anopheles atroparvus TaxID=41427 RepID=A0AAG5CTJ1_ANOAO
MLSKMFAPFDTDLCIDITKPPPPVDDSFPHSKLLEQLRQSDEILVQEFMSSRTLKPSISRKTTEPLASVDITAYRAELCDVLKALEELKHSKLMLEKLHNSPDENDARCSDEVERTGQVKKALSDQLNALENEERLSALTHKLAVRKKKRAWQKRRNERLKNAKEVQRAERALRLEEIVRWESEWKTRLAKEQATREELQAKTLVLADVRRRKARAKRYLSRFEKTIRLHQHRQSASKEKHPMEETCPEEVTGERFRKNVDTLIGEWKSKLAECNREERRLKDELARRFAGNEGRRRENRWRKALFGDAAALINGGRGTTDRYDIIETRWSWDAYALPASLTEGSTEGVPSEKGYTVPTGWIFPPENPLPEWAIYREPTKIKSEKNIGVSGGGKIAE